MGRNVRGCEIGSQKIAGDSVTEKARDNPSVHERAFEIWSAGSDLELQHGRDVRCRRRAGRRDTQTAGAVFVGKNLEAVGNGIGGKVAAGIAQRNGMGRRRAHRDAARFWTIWMACSCGWSD